MQRQPVWASVASLNHATVVAKERCPDLSGERICLSARRKDQGSATFATWPWTNVLR
jgi:hypothetical protein